MIESLFEMINYKIMCNICNKDNSFRTRGARIERVSGGPYIIDLEEDKTRICEHCGSELEK